jgi:hypothetical protein
MSLDWRTEDIGSFFGNNEREILEYKPGSKLFIVEYAGKLLRYSFWFHITDEYVMVSGNDGTPFGADSLYEIVVPCDSVTLHDDPYDRNQSGLAFWYGDPKHKMNLTMMLLKRPDGDLKVWPTTVWPYRHPYQQSMLNADPNALNRYNCSMEK